MKPTDEFKIPGILASAFPVNQTMIQLHMQLTIADVLRFQTDEKFKSDVIKLLDQKFQNALQTVKESRDVNHD